jgi:hypothetical protein
MAKVGERPFSLMPFPEVQNVSTKPDNSPSGPYSFLAEAPAPSAPFSFTFCLLLNG